MIVCVLHVAIFLCSRKSPTHDLMTVMELGIHEGYTTLVAVLNGSVQINETDILRDAELASLDREGQEVVLESNNDARLLVLSGEPIDEPVVGYGPFVMNTEGEIKQAMLDFQSGKFGAL